MLGTIQQYFIDKKIPCIIKEVGSTSFDVYEVELKNISDFKKVKNIETELQYYLHDNDISIQIADTIKIIKNKKEYKKDDTFLKYHFDKLSMNVGITADNKRLFVDLIKDPHILIAGATGSGKSVFLNNCIKYLRYNYGNIDYYFIDLKQVELTSYDFGSVATTDTQAQLMLEDILDMIQRRYEDMKKNHVRSIEELPYYRYTFLVIDEMAELFYRNKDLQSILTRILQLGRACGVHVIAATQRPSTDVISGILKVNFNVRVCFKVGNRHDSTTILNQKGAENLCGNGDGLIICSGSFIPRRFQAYYC